VTDKPTIYILGPMRGHRWYNYPTFDLWRVKLEAAGWNVISPADLDRRRGMDPFHLPPDHDWSQVMPGIDIEAVLAEDCHIIRHQCDAGFALDGWIDSHGAMREHVQLAAVNTPVFYESAGVVPLPSMVATPDHIPAATEKGQDEIRVRDETTGGEKGSKSARYDLIPPFGGEAAMVEAGSLCPAWKLELWWGMGCDDELRQAIGVAVQIAGGWERVREELAEHYGKNCVTHGGKYEERNWEKGYAWSLCYSAAHRHWSKYRRHEIERDDDPPHSRHIIAFIWHLITLWTFQDRGIGTDDRPGRDASA